MESTEAGYEASARQAKRRSLLYIAVAIIPLIVGGAFLDDIARYFITAGLTMVAWTAVQVIGIAYLRTSPKHPALMLNIVGGTATVLAVLALTFFTAGWAEALVVAGAWYAFIAAVEFGRGQQWRKALAARTTSGEIVRTLAVHTGYDGIPLASFLLSGALVGLWAWLLDLLPWLTPFAVLVHVAVALGLSANPASKD